MTVTVLVPRTLTSCTGDERRLTVSGSTVGEVLDDIAARHPYFDRRVRDETGALRQHVNVYVDGEDVRRAEGLGTAVGDDAEVQIIQSVAGG